MTWEQLSSVQAISSSRVFLWSIRSYFHSNWLPEVFSACLAHTVHTVRLILWSNASPILSMRFLATLRISNFCKWSRPSSTLISEENFSDLPVENLITVALQPEDFEVHQGIQSLDLPYCIGIPALLENDSAVILTSKVLSNLYILLGLQFSPVWSRISTISPTSISHSVVNLLTSKGHPSRPVITVISCAIRHNSFNPEQDWLANDPIEISAYRQRYSSNSFPENWNVSSPTSRSSHISCRLFLLKFRSQHTENLL